MRLDYMQCFYFQVEMVVVNGQTEVSCFSWFSRKSNIAELDSLVHVRALSIEVVRSSGQIQPQQTITTTRVRALISGSIILWRSE